MKTLHHLSTMAKTRLLQRLFPLEVIEFVAHHRILTRETIDDQEEIRRIWGRQVLEPGLWLQLARKTEHILRSNPDTLAYWDKPFCKKLFKGKVFLLTYSSLLGFLEAEDCSPKFREAVQLFFGS